MKRLFALTLLLACGRAPGTEPGREYVKDMIGSAAYESFSANPHTRDGKTMQPPPEGTLPRGYQPFDYAPTTQDAARAGAELKNPLQPTADNVARGDKVFHTVCFTCHGNEGKGDGPVVPRFPQPPPLTAPHAKALADGQIFHIITRGQGLMPPHAAQVQPADRWAAVLYVRKLQGSAL